MKREFERNTHEEEAAIIRGIALDPDKPEWTDADFVNARPASGMMPAEMLKAFAERRMRGPQKAPTKVSVSIRLDRDVVEKLKEAGPGLARAAERGVAPGGAGIGHAATLCPHVQSSAAAKQAAKPKHSPLPPPYRWQGSR